MLIPHCFWMFTERAGKKFDFESKRTLRVNETAARWSAAVYVILFPPKFWVRENVKRLLLKRCKPVREGL